MNTPLILRMLRGLQIFWTLLLTALIGNAIALDRSAAGTAKAAVNFSMFVAVLCWLASIYGLVCSIVSAAFRPVAAIVLDAGAVFFSFIAAIVLSAKLGAVDCGNFDHDSKSNDYIAFGTADTEKRCREIQGGAVFLWFLLICFAVTLTFSVKEARGLGGSIRSSRSRPSMVQVGV